MCFATGSGVWAHRSLGLMLHNKSSPPTWTLNHISMIQYTPVPMFKVGLTTPVMEVYIRRLVRQRVRLQDTWCSSLDVVL